MTLHFWRGAWHTVDMVWEEPLFKPYLYEANSIWLRARLAGADEASAVETVERELYARILGITTKDHGGKA